MLIFFSIVHVVLCFFMIFVILLQPGKDAGMGAALGGGAATSAFGGRGAVTFLSKLTAVCAGLFFLTSLGLSLVGVRQSVLPTSTAPAPVSSPAGATSGTPAPIPPGEVAKPPEGSAAPAGGATEAPKAAGEQAAPTAPATPESAPAPAPKSP